MSANVQIEITISGEALAAIPRIKDQPGLAHALAKAMDRQNLLLVSYIQKTYLDFPRNGPTTLEGLRNISGSYFRSLRAARTVILGGGLESSIGTNVKSRGGVSYPAVHEFGATIPSRSTRSKNKYYAKKHPMTRGFTLPARSPIQRGIADRTPAYSDALSGACLNFWKGEAA